MNATSSRSSLSELARKEWDVLLIGGGITGAGIFSEASRVGLKTLLVERDDFASGTSSHSAKLIHGGLHYLARFQLGLARESVRERNRLLRDGSGMIEPLEFMLPLTECERLHTCATTLGLGVYQAMSGKFQRPRHIRGPELDQAAPGLDPRYRDALCYMEGQTDDARLTLRSIAEGRRAGGSAQNYTAAVAVSRTHRGQVTGAVLYDSISGETKVIAARCVINAAGPWSDDVRAWIGRPVRQRLVGGSHLVFPHEKLPIETGLAVYHPESGLPLYLVPWRNVTLVGTTHLDSGTSGERPARATIEETNYLLSGVQSLFPNLKLTLEDVRSTFSGYRPIVDTSTRDPSQASRDYGIWVEDGMITVTGGKLTTYRSIARQVVRKVAPRVSFRVDTQQRRSNSHVTKTEVTDTSRSQHEGRRLTATYGPDAHLAMMEMPSGEHAALPNSGGTTLAEIRWAARSEDVVHLDDLLSRRVRLAVVAPNGGSAHFDRIEQVAREELGWDHDRWSLEVGRYRELWRARYAVPGQVELTPVVDLEGSTRLEPQPPMKILMIEQDSTADGFHDGISEETARQEVAIR